MTGELRVLQRLNKYELAVELDILRDGLIHVGGTSGNGPKQSVANWEYLNLEKYYRTFAGKPLLIAYVGSRVGDGHNSQTKTDPETGERYESYMAPTAERIVGMVSEDEKDLTLLARDDGYTWERVKGRIWTNYAPELTEKLMRTGRMSVSVETNVLQSRVEDDVEKMEIWEGLGVSLLGDGVAPAVPGANIRVLAAMQQEFEEMKLRVASLREEEERPQPPESGRSETKRSDRKGVEKRMNKMLRKELESKFSDYFVAGASDDGMAVALLSKNGVDAYSYEFEESDKGNVIADRIKPTVLSSSMKVGERDIEVDITRVSGFYDTEVARLTQKCEELAARCEALEAAQKDMETRETARRIKASVSAAERQLAEINSNRAECERFEDVIIDGIKKRAEDGEFAGCVDGEGNWCGEDAVCAAVCEVCMKKQMEMDKCKREALKTAAQKRYTFEPEFAAADEAKGGLEALYADMVQA